VLREAVVDIFDFWKQSSNHPRARMDDKRARYIRRALDWGYEPADLKLAIYGCCTSPWHNGQNERGGVYTDLTLILRDGDHIDRFMKTGEYALQRAFREASEEHERRTRAAAQRAQIPGKVRELFKRG
jgi:hypothetical protein